MNRDEAIGSGIPDLIADVVLYSAEDGGRNSPAFLGWGCPVKASKTDSMSYSAWPLLGDTPLLPGAKRRLGFVFVNKDGVEKMRTAGTFFLWEGGFIGEATIVD